MGSYNKKENSMKRSIILSNLRIELRKKNSDYNTEKLAQKWVNEFLDEFSIVDSTQLNHWQKEVFLGKLKHKSTSQEEYLQARSALLFLYSRVLKIKSISASPHQTEEFDLEPGVIRITA